MIASANCYVPGELPNFTVPLALFHGITSLAHFSIMLQMWVFEHIHCLTRVIICLMALFCVDFNLRNKSSKTKSASMLSVESALSKILAKA